MKIYIFIFLHLFFLATEIPTVDHSMAPSSSLHSSPGTSPPSTEKSSLTNSFFGAMRKYTKGLTDLVEGVIVFICLFVCLF